MEFLLEQLSKDLGLFGIGLPIFELQMWIKQVTLNWLQEMHKQKVLPLWFIGLQEQMDGLHATDRWLFRFFIAQQMEMPHRKKWWNKYQR